MMKMMSSLVVMRMSEPMWLDGDPIALGMDDDDEEFEEDPDLWWDAINED